MSLEIKNMSQLLIERICKDYNMEDKKEEMIRNYIFGSFNNAIEDVVTEEYFCGEEIDFSKLPEEIPEISFSEPNEEVVVEEEIVVEEEEEIIIEFEVEDEGEDEDDSEGLFSGDDESDREQTPLPPTLSKTPIKSPEPELAAEEEEEEEEEEINYNKMNVKQLKELCKSAGIKGFYKMKKAQMIETLQSQ